MPSDTFIEIEIETISIVTTTAPAPAPITDSLRVVVSRPDCIVYPGGRPYVSAERLYEIADEIDAEVARLMAERAAEAIARIDAVAEAAEWEAAHAGASILLRLANRDLAALAAWGEEALGRMVLLIGQVDDLEAENEGLSQALRDTGDVCDLLLEQAKKAKAEAARQEAFADVSDNIATSLGSRLTNLNADLSGLLCELGVDSDEMGEDELVPALRGEIARLQAKVRPRGFLARLFGC